MQLMSTRSSGNFTGHLYPGNGAIAISTGSVSANTWQFGYQGIAGIRYDINPTLALDLDYRYLATPSFTVNGARANTAGGCCVFGSIKSRYQTQNILASLTMKFGPPPAATADAAGAAATAGTPSVSRVLRLG